MTISTTASKSRYAGDGGTAAFPTGFRFIDNSHVRVVLREADGSETLWTEGSEYSLSGAGQPGGGTVTVSASPIDHTPAGGATLVVMLAVPARQDTALPLGGAFPSTAVEQMADLAALRDQQLEEALSRAPKFKATTALANVEFPEPAAGKPVGWNAAGDALVNFEALGRWQGDWRTATNYVALDVVRDPTTKNVYVCELAHTSNDFGDDLAAGRWSLAISVEDAEAAATAAAAAQAATELAQATAEAARAGAEAAEGNAAASVSAAATSETNAGNSAMAAAGSAAAATAAATAAETAATDAAASEAAAMVSEVAAATSATNAATSETAAEAAQAAAEALYGDLQAVEDAVTAAQAARAAAELAESNAEAAEANAASSASGVTTSASNAAASATAAAGSASTASTMATAAQAAQDAAGAAQGAAEAAQAAAETAETDAEAAAMAAAASAAQVEGAKLIWRSDWSGATAYAANDAVAHDGASWICIQAHINQEPPSATYWDVLAAKGVQGDQGIQGEQGIQGDAGIGIVPQGTYSAGTTYVLNQGVTYQGSFWRSLQNGNAGNTPTNSPSHWEQMVERGATGPAADTVIMLAVSDETTAIEAGTGKLSFRMPHAFTLSAVRASLKTASSSGAVTVDINENGATILSTKLTIDQGEKSSTTAATPAVISDANLTDDAEMTVDIDGAGSGATGLKVTLIGVPA